jgi:hypothetical protein
MQTLITDPDQNALDVQLPYDKEVFSRRIGYVNEKYCVIINRKIVEANIPFNLYELLATFYKGREKTNLDDTTFYPESFMDWLLTNEYVRLFKDNVELNDVLEYPVYSVYPFFPSQKDVLWVCRVLQTNLELFSCNDITLLALYREISINGKDVEQVILQRNFDNIIALLTPLQRLHQSCCNEFNKQLEGELSC